VNQMDAGMLAHKSACAELIQSWGFYRDQGKWPQLLDTFVPDGQISVSWFTGNFSDFVDRCRQAFESGQRSKHQIFPSLVEVAGGRAMAETNIVILVRQKIGTVIADLTSYARFLDRLEQAGARWRIVERTAIYERDASTPSSRRKASSGCSKAPSCRPTRKRTATWRPGLLRPVAPSRRSSIATAPRIRRSSIFATRLGSRADSSAAVRLTASVRNPHLKAADPVRANVE